jgi:hypothetical protein
MFKDIQRGLGKFFTTERVVILFVFLVLGFILHSYSSSKHYVIDRMTNNSNYSPSYGLDIPSMSQSSQSLNMMNTMPPIMNTSSSSPPEINNTIIPPITTNTNQTLQPVANPNDLLPKDANSEWGNLNTLNSNNITTPDLLQAGYHIGLDTIGQTLRNANLQERSDPIIPKQQVGPWNMSTIEPDFGRTPLEVGCGPR